MGSVGGAPQSPQCLEQELAQKDIIVYQDLLKHLPPDSHDDLRKSFEDRISAAKRAVTKSKPITSQLSACVAALDRAQVKYKKAEDAMMKASSEYENARSERQRLADEKSRLEGEIFHGQPSKSCLDSLGSSFQQVLSDMQHSSLVDQSVVTQAQFEMESLFGKLASLAASIKAAGGPQASGSDASASRDGQKKR